MYGKRQTLPRPMATPSMASQVLTRLENRSARCIAQDGRRSARVFARARSVITRGRASRRVEHAGNEKTARIGALQTMFLPARQIDERTTGDRCSLFARPHEARTGEDGDRLLVVMEVLGRARKRDRADELRDTGAPHPLVDHELIE